MFSGDRSAETGGTNLENNDFSWVKVVDMNHIISIDAVLDVVDSEWDEIFVMWPVGDDELEPLEQYIEFSSHTRARIM